MSGAANTWTNSVAAKQALIYLHYSYPVALLITFLVVFLTHSIRTAAPEEDGSRNGSIQTGPGGKPLPGNKKLARKSERNPEFGPGSRLTFCWLSVGVVLTFLANAALICVHALAYREQKWWCGKSVAVSIIDPSDPLFITDSLVRSMSQRHSSSTASS